MWCLRCEVKYRSIWTKEYYKNTKEHLIHRLSLKRSIFWLFPLGFVSHRAGKGEDGGFRAVVCLCDPVYTVNTLWDDVHKRRSFASLFDSLQLHLWELRTDSALRAASVSSSSMDREAEAARLSWAADRQSCDLSWMAAAASLASVLALSSL